MASFYTLRARHSWVPVWLLRTLSRTRLEQFVGVREPAFLIRVNSDPTQFDRLIASLAKLGAR